MLQSVGMFSSHEGGMFLNSRFTNDEIKFQTLGIEVSLKGHPSHCPSHSLLMGIVNISLTLQKALLNTHVCTPLKILAHASSSKWAQSILVWLFRNRQNSTLDTKPQLISWPFLTWDFICVYYSQEENSSLCSHVTQRQLRGQVIGTEWQAQHLLRQRNWHLFWCLLGTQSALSPFQKTTPSS